MGPWARCGLAAVAGAFVGFENGRAQESTGFPDDLPIRLLHEEILPAGRAICLRLGLDPHVPGRCHAAAALGMSLRQTDPTLWFSKSTTAVGGNSVCYDPVPFSRSTTNGGIEYLCHASQADVAITAEDLAALEAEAARLNAIPHKTLAEHNRALQMKTDLGCATGLRVEGCD